MPDHRPIPDSYWIRPGALLAGEYPGAKDEAEARRKLRRLLEAGITFFVDLTEKGEYGLNPYATLLLEEAGRFPNQRIEYRRLPIQDISTPEPELMEEILALIDGAIAARHKVYVHCYGGIGRTGTVVGCFLVRQGTSGDEALAEIARLRTGIPNGWRQSPETPEQREMILDWK
jgi:protein-tyrosine phosphatase